jgi:hypothetical protein
MIHRQSVEGGWATQVYAALKLSKSQKLKAKSQKPKAKSQKPKAKS